MEGYEEKLEFLEKLLQEKRFTELKEYLVNMMPADIAEFIDTMKPTEALIVYRLLSKTEAVEVFPLIDMERQKEITSLISEEELKAIVDEMFFDDMMDLLGEVPANIVKKILKNTTQKQRTLINQFLKYPEESAGSLMTIEFVDLHKKMNAQEAMTRIRKTGLDKETIYTCYVMAEHRELEGIVSLKNLVLAQEDELVENLMTDEFISVNTHDDQEYIAEIFKKYDLLSVPVVDNERRLVGIITIDDIVDVIEEETTEDFQLMAAIAPSDDEYMSMSAFTLAKKRIVWLVVLMFSATISQLITDKHSYLTAQFTVLVGVMPMLMSTGGNAGAQSSTLVIRGLTLGDIKFSDLFKVIWKEIRVGIIIGVTLGFLNFLRIMLFSQDIKLAIIVGLTLIGTTTMAALMGGILPIVAKKAKLDPAIMASPLITTITDATTLLIFFTIAAWIFLGI
ncbi:magnesium transporter [Vallitaleaceae bacterium 9-2]